MKKIRKKKVYKPPRRVLYLYHTNYILNIRKTMGMTDGTLLELTGTVEQIIYRNEQNGYTILELDAGDELVVVVGSLPFVSVGEELHVIGKWVTHPTFGEQFKAETFERSRPATTHAMLKYLSSGAIKGIGKATAARIVDAFGENTMDVIEKEPERLCSIKGITLKKAQNISEEFQRSHGVKKLMMSLSKYGITPEEAIRIWKLYGGQAVEMVETDPFCLCAEGINVDFSRADRIAQILDYPQDDASRIYAGILYILRHNLQNGHTCLPEKKLLDAACRMLQIEPKSAEDCLANMLEEQAVIAETFEEKRFLFYPPLHQSEVFIASRLTMLLRFPPQSIVGIKERLLSVEKHFQIQYAERQKQAIRDALEKGILILTGGPGTGKTTTLNAMILLLEEHGERVSLAAPTGRAAKRMSELTGREATTIHRLLQVEWNENDRPVFAKNEKNLLRCDALILDELSMIDTFLFEHVLRALPLGCRLIMVGDCDQLPSVGPGNILGSLIATKLIPVVQLNEIFRQSMQSLIVTNAHKIVAGKMPDLNEKNSDFFFLPRNTIPAISSVIVDLCARRLPARYGYQIWSEIQVLCPSRKGELGTVELNQKLQDSVNPKEKNKREISINGMIFREGDKVMQVKNNYDLTWSKNDGSMGEGVFNGDIGILLEIDFSAGILTVQMDDKLVQYQKEDAIELELAYAMTVHKSQGNEFPVIVMPMYPGAPQLNYRNLLYTAITRAKSILILIGKESTVKTMVENDRKTRRYSGLSYFLKEDMSHEI